MDLLPSRREAVTAAQPCHLVLASKPSGGSHMPVDGSDEESRC